MRRLNMNKGEVLTFLEHVDLETKDNMLVELLTNYEKSKNRIELVIEDFASFVYTCNR